MSRYGKITGSKNISEDYQNINIALDNIEADVDAKAAVVTSHTNNADIHVTAAQKQAWDAKADGSTSTELADHVADQTVHVTQDDHDKLDNIEPGAQVNQPAFSRVNDISASDPESQFFIVGGLGITVTTNPITGEVTVTATGDAAPAAHGITHTEFGADPIPAATVTEGGIMSAAQAAELIAHGDLLQQHDTAITSLSERLDTADTSSVTLQPGLQVIQAEKDARFRLDQIEGKTEINGQGRIGLIGVESPYVINTSGNLLPPFYEWTWLGGSVKKVEAPYQMAIDQKAADGWQFISCKVSVTANTDYRFACSHNMRTSIANGEGTESIVPYTEEQFIQFNSGTFTEISVYFSSIELGEDVVYTLANPSLTVGNEPQPFAPQRKSMLAFDTELHANPTDGSEPDILFEETGAYRKLTKWKKVVLDGAWAWESHDQASGYKVARITGGKVSGFADSSPVNKFVTKYNGVSLPWIDGAADEGAFWNDLNFMGGTLLVVVMNTDSGWGDDYIPTQDEIKAYFNGWRMCNGNTGLLYTGAEGEAKLWGPIANPQNIIGGGGWVDYVIGSVPTQKAPVSAGYEYHPYNLLYRLAKETVEPVVTEGSLLLSEGDNSVEVGTGIVLRERANPQGSSTYSGYYINENNIFPGSILKSKTSKILKVYRNSGEDSWRITTGNAYGNELAFKSLGEYDLSASYSVTYIKLDKSPIQPITGTQAANEKAQISDLTAGVTEALHRVSVVEQKKAEKDAPGWIMPTLLNGAVHGSIPVTYKKTADNVVHISGLFVAPASTIIFRLPLGYRPKMEVRAPIASFDVEGSLFPSFVYITFDGKVIVGAIGNNYASFDGISFPIE